MNEAGALLAFGEQFVKIGVFLRELGKDLIDRKNKIA